MAFAAAFRQAELSLPLREGQCEASAAGAHGEGLAESAASLEDSQASEWTESNDAVMLK